MKYSEQAMNYDWKCIHVKCREFGGSHVRGQFRHKKHTGGYWIKCDYAAVLDGGSVGGVWCGDGILQAVNPS